MASSLAFIAFLSGAVSGCGTQPPSGDPSEASSSLPSETSDDKVLADASAAYSAYVSAADAVFADGGRSPEKLSDVATGTALELVESDAEQFREMELHSVGRTVLSGFKLQSRNVVGQDVEDATLYVCEDVSGIDILDSSGKSLVSPDRISKQTFEVSVERSAGTAILLVNAREPWYGDGACS